MDGAALIAAEQAACRFRPYLEEGDFLPVVRWKAKIIQTFS